MNHWQRQWLSDRLHKKHQSQPVRESTAPAEPAPIKPKQPRKPKIKQKLGNKK
jgi:hypothetical protein